MALSWRVNQPLIIVKYTYKNNRCCAQVTACGVRTRTKYATRVATSATGGAFKMLGNPACSPNNNLTAINGTAPTAENVVQAVKRGGIVNA